MTATHDVSDLDDQIAAIRANIRDLIEQASGASGAAAEEFQADRINEQQAELDRLIKERDARLAG
ncbi:hypothetical protein [Azorhizobium doebereinerae]|uniref:hypothetical protein n=1 Tax=Azorhizobium doebereinerae TaxID=281091 RepID=UPI0004256EAA|nr:hypothetical protein [Azorhizobium doebereinerae]